MRVLILGGDGMLGHRLLKTLRSHYETRVTLRLPLSHYAKHRLFDERNSFADVSMTDTDRLIDVMAQFRPQVLVNAVGVVKQRPEAQDPIVSLQINSLLPHRLGQLAALMGSRLIHVSTDCVFSGRKGNYSEDDVADAEDLYGRTKLLGEVSAPHCLTLRTSIIGRELERRSGLLEWFLSQTAKVEGYRRAIYTGLTTQELSRVMATLISTSPSAHGLWHVSSEPISKYALLQLFAKYYHRDTSVVAEDSVVCDRSLNSERFRVAYRYTPPPWEQMVAELTAEEA